MNGIPGIAQVIRKSGLFNIFKVIQRRLSNRKVINYRLYQELLCDKCGIEIGGPSSFFRHQLPIYKKIKSLDGVNFSSSTIWEGEILEGKNYKYANRQERIPVYL